MLVPDDWSIHRIINEGGEKYIGVRHDKCMLASAVKTGATLTELVIFMHEHLKECDK